MLPVFSVFYCLSALWVVVSVCLRWPSDKMYDTEIIDHKSTTNVRFFSEDTPQSSRYWCNNETQSKQSLKHQACM